MPKHGHEFFIKYIFEVRQEWVEEKIKNKVPMSFLTNDMHVSRINRRFLE